MGQQKEMGFGALAIVITVVAILAAGLVTWRVLSSPSQPNQTAQSSQASNTPAQQNSQPQTQADPNAGYFVVKEWGVRFKPVSGLSGITYSVDSQATPEEARFSTMGLEQYGDSCGTGPTSRPPLGGLSRTKTQKQEFTSGGGEFVKHIGDYYYQYTTPQSACADTLHTPADALQTQTLALFKPSIATLEAAK